MLRRPIWNQAFDLKIVSFRICFLSPSYEQRNYAKFMEMQFLNRNVNFKITVLDYWCLFNYLEEISLNTKPFQTF